MFQIQIKTIQIEKAELRIFFALFPISKAAKIFKTL